METIKVNGEYIQLNQFLKMQNIAMSGGEARAMIENGEVKVNGEITSVIRKKLYTGYTVECGIKIYKIEAEN